MVVDEKLPVGTNFCLCPLCGHYFGGVGAFDLHIVRTENGRNCADPRALVAKKGANRGKPLLRLNEKGYWVQNYG